MLIEVINIKTSSYNDQEFGTSGIRKKVSVFKQENYLQNILASIFEICSMKNKSIILAGDGRYFNKEAINIAIKMLVAKGAKKVFVGKDGLLSTPAASIFIKKYKLDYGIIFSASHNPAGVNGDFGVKVNGSNGSSITEDLCKKIYNYTKSIKSYFTIKNLSFSTSKIQKVHFLNTEIEVINPISDYTELMENIFDFNKISSLFKNGFSMLYEAYSAITGIYAKDIFVNKLQLPLNSILNSTPLEDFGGMHADPNSLNAKHLIDISKTSTSPDILFASDGDGDRNMIIGKDNMVVSSSDSLAVIVNYAYLIPYYKNNFGVARSLPTSKAADSVAKNLNINHFSVPTGWKFFGNLLESKKITFCGEESYGTGSVHSGEKDGIWAMLFWLNIIAETKLSVKEIILKLWQTYGRFYYLRLDYFNITVLQKNEIFNNFMSMNNKVYLNENITTEIFNYTDPVTNEYSSNKAFIMKVGSKSRIVLRASGTDTENITLRIYIEKLETNMNNLLNNAELFLKDLQNLILNNVTKNIKPSLID